MKEPDSPYPSLDTPAVLLDLDKLEANIREMSQLAGEAGLRLRPHVKMHESAFIAKLQMAAGACGIEVGPIDQAEAFVDEGLNDVLIAHPFYGSHKFEKLRRLLNKETATITVVVDMLEQAEGISAVGRAVGRRVPVYLKIETGGNRYGVLPGQKARRIAKKLSDLPGIELTGVYAHETIDEPTDEVIERSAFVTASTVSDVASALRKEGISIRHVAVGASPTFRATCRYKRQGKLPEVTEIHSGSSVVGDMRYVTGRATTEERCALTVLVSVMSTSHPGHAVVDAGMKTFGADAMVERLDTPGFLWDGKPRYGSVRGRPDLYLGELSNEVSCIYYRDTDKKVTVGERLEIIPNNAMIVINGHDSLHGVRGGKMERMIPVTARGRGN